VIPAQQLRCRIEKRELTTGLLVSSHLWPQLVEIAMAGGLDYLIADTEHLDHGAARIAEVCALGRIAGFPILLRTRSTDEASVRAAMDIGPCGLLLPNVERAEQLDEVKKAAYLPPRGGRRPGGPGNFWVKQYDYDSFKTVVEDNLIVIPQVESQEGLDNASEIAAHELTTALGIGPFDLSAQLGVCGEGIAHPRMRSAVDQLRNAADAADKPMWMIGPPRPLIDQGFRFLCIGDVFHFLRNALRSELDELKQLSQADASGPLGS